MPALDSSNIASADHDPATGDLRVTFKNGSTYIYSNVPEHVVEGLHSAESAGGYLNSQIKGQYDYRRA